MAKGKGLAEALSAAPAPLPMEEPEAEEDESLEVVAADLLGAIRANDPKGVAAALRAMYDTWME